MLSYILASCCHTIHIHGRAHSNIPIETSRISLQQIRSKRLACVRCPRSNADYGNPMSSDTSESGLLPSRHHIRSNGAELSQSHYALQKLVYSGSLVYLSFPTQKDGF